MRRCPRPRCRSGHLLLEQLVAGVAARAEQRAGRLAVVEPAALLVLEPAGVRARCRECLHSWELRGVRRLADVGLPQARSALP